MMNDDNYEFITVDTGPVTKSISSNNISINKFDVINESIRECLDNDEHTKEILNDIINNIMRREDEIYENFMNHSIVTDTQHTEILNKFNTLNIRYSSALTRIDFLVVENRDLSHEVKDLTRDNQKFITKEERLRESTLFRFFNRIFNWYKL